MVSKLTVSRWASEGSVLTQHNIERNLFKLIQWFFNLKDVCIHVPFDINWFMM